MVVDDVDLDTNLPQGSVTYALALKETPKVGDKILVSKEGQYVYEVASINGDVCMLEDKLSTDGAVQEKTLESLKRKVLFTVPFIGYVSMALRTTEGLIIVGLVVVFVIILFILAEIWKKDDDEEEDGEDDEEDDDDGDDEDESEEAEAEDDEDDEADEEPQMSRRQQKKAEKAAEKEAKKEAKKAEKQAEKEAEKKEKKKAKKGAQKSEQKAEESTVEDELRDAGLIPREEETEPTKNTEEDEALFAETESILAADIAGMLGFGTEEKESEEPAGGAEKTPEAAAEEQKEAEPEEKKPEEKKLAMPVYTKEELLEKAKAAGDEPNVIEDEVSGVTLLDYSDIL